MAPRGVADRVLLGLLPSSRGGWVTALAALKPRGGVLHLHENVKVSACTAAPFAISISCQSSSREQHQGSAFVLLCQAKPLCQSCSLLTHS